MNSLINLQEVGARTLSTTGPAQIAATAVANSTSRLAVTTPSRLPRHAAPTNPLVPNTLLSFEALMRVGIVRSGNGPTARSAPQQIPSASASNSVQNTNDDMTGDNSPSAAAVGALLVNAGVHDDNPLEVEGHAGPASPIPRRRLQGFDERDEEDAVDDNFDELSSGSGEGRSLTYLEAATKKRTPTLVDCASQRRRIVSPRQVTSASTKGAAVQSNAGPQKRAAKTFYGEATQPKRAKAAPAAAEKKKKERKSRKPPRKGLKVMN